MNKLEQLRVIGRKIHNLTEKTDNISVKINNTKNKRKKTWMFKKLNSINKEKLFYHKLYFTIYNS